MAVYLIQFTKVNPTTDLGKMDEAIKARGDGWFRFFDDSWLINARPGDTPEAIAKSLFPLMKDTDRIFVVQLQRNFYGWLPLEAWDWLNSALF